VKRKKILENKWKEAMIKLEDCSLSNMVKQWEERAIDEARFWESRKQSEKKFRGGRGICVQHNEEYWILSENKQNNGGGESHRKKIKVTT
jgi:hypothetical protein